MATRNIGFTDSNVTRIQPNAQPQRKAKRAAFESYDQPEAKRRKVDSSKGRTNNLSQVQPSYHVNQAADDFANVAQQIIQKLAETPTSKNKWDFQVCIPPVAAPIPIVEESNSSLATPFSSPRLASDSRLSGGTMTQEFYNDGIVQRHPDEKNGITGDGLVGNTSAESKLKQQLATLAKFHMKLRQEELKEAKEKQRQLEPASSKLDFLAIDEDSDEDGFIGSLGKLNIKSNS